jgi:hypothetical protein
MLNSVAKIPGQNPPEALTKTARMKSRNLNCSRMGGMTNVRSKAIVTLRTASA